MSGSKSVMKKDSDSIKPKLPGSAADKTKTRVKHPCEITFSYEDE